MNEIVIIEQENYIRAKWTTTDPVLLPVIKNLNQVRLKLSKNLRLSILSDNIISSKVEVRIHKMIHKLLCGRTSYILLKHSMTNQKHTLFKIGNKGPSFFFFFFR